jgi:hypothetical protein
MANALRMGITSLRRLENAQLVRVMVDEHGWRWFDPDQIAQVIGQRPLAKSAWAMFSEGKSVHEVVASLDAEPDAVLEWHKAWCEASGYIVVALPRRDPQELAYWLRAYGLTAEDLKSPHRWFRALEMCLSSPALREILESADPIPLPKGFT